MDIRVTQENILPLEHKPAFHSQEPN
jgi:hypothetical protein